MKETNLIFSQEVSLDLSPDVASTLDKSRYKNNGTNTNVTYSRLPSGLWVHTFAGNGGVDCGNTPSIYNTMSKLSVSAWAKATDFSVDMCIVAKDVSPGRSWYLRFLVGQLEFTVYKVGDTGTQVYGEFGVKYTDGYWHHILATYEYVTDGTSLASMYIDGVKSSRSRTNAVGPIQISASSNLTIGRRTLPASINYYTGDIGLVKVWRDVLSYGEGVQLYESERRWFGR